MEIREYKCFDKNEIYCLYSSVGWTAYTDDMAALQAGYENSLSVLAAYENGELLGIIRAVGDGSTVMFIQDILVFPKWQRRGVGTALIGAMLKKYKNVRQIELVTDNEPKTIEFYKAAGFKELSEIGCCGFMRCR